MLKFVKSWEPLMNVKPWDFYVLRNVTPWELLIIVKNMYVKES